MFFNNLVQWFINALPIPILIVKRDLRCWAKNKATIDLFGRDAEKCYNLINGVRDESCNNCPVKFVFESGKPYRRMREYKGKQLEFNAQPWIILGKVRFAVIIIQDKTKEIIKQRSVEELVRSLADNSRTDALTQAYNRAGIVELIEQEIGRSKRHKNPFSLIMFDIDHFKRINDEFGHLAGDYVIKEVVGAAKLRLRTADAIGRYGGEEFIILLRETDATQAFYAAEGIRKKIEGVEFEGFSITVSCGVAEFNPNSSLVEDLIESADSAMYRAKQSGRNMTMKAERA